jgi:LPXTG-motif cell wall-anchored protein
VLGAGEDAADAVSPAGALPYTGSDTRGVTIAGAALLLVGMGLALASRSRITG